MQSEIEQDEGNLTSKLFLSAEHARMSVHFGHDVLDLQGVQIEVHFFAILCDIV